MTVTEGVNRINDEFENQNFLEDVKKKSSGSTNICLTFT